MSKLPFTKFASTPEELLQKLEYAGLIFSDVSRQQAHSYLRYVGGYRLKGYWFHLVDPSSKLFPSGCTFDDISARYEFDRELRAATISSIDRLEVAIRAVMANFLSLKHSPHWFLIPSIFKPTREWGIGQLVKKIEDEVRRATSKRFVEHYYSRHDEPYLPPSWVVSECVTFGLWSRTFAILRDGNDKKAISKKFGIDQVDVFQSWIHMLTVVRNIAAHQGQLLKVKLGVAPANYKSAGIKFTDQKSFFAAATVIQFMLNQTGLPHRWRQQMEGIFKKYPTVSISDLGFPVNWQSSPGWNV